MAQRVDVVDKEKKLLFEMHPAKARILIKQKKVIPIFLIGKKVKFAVQRSN